MSEEKKKVSEKDLETMSGGCGGGSKPKRKFEKGDAVWFWRSRLPNKMFIGFVIDYDYNGGSWDYSVKSDKDPNDIRHNIPEYKLKRY